MRTFFAAAALTVVNTVFFAALFLAALFLAAGAAHAACWQTADQPPPVTFTATQAGAPITGRFLEYQGRLCLPETGDSASGSGHASVAVSTGSIDMGMPEFDKEMRGPLWFDSERWPQAEFRADRVEHLDGNRYRLSGELTIRDVTRPFSAEVELDPASDALHVTGDVELSRLAFDVGTGEWSDTRWVGDKVTVHLSTTLSPAD